MKTHLISAVMLALSGVAVASDYVAYDFRNDTNTSYHYDKDSLKIATFANAKKGKKYLQVTERWGFVDTRQHSPNQNYNVVLADVAYDCQNNKAVLTAVQLYYYGTFVANVAMPSYNQTSSDTWQAVMPKTALHSNHKQLCKAYRKQLR